MVTRVDESLCLRCGGCVITCPFGCIFLKDKIEIKDCRSCGICIKSCPVGALSDKK